MTQLLLVAPLRSEIEAFTIALAVHGYAPVQLKIGRIDVLRFKELELVVARGGHGKTQFGLQTQHLIDNGGGDFDGVVCFGAAGALDPRIVVGDVVVAQETVEHDYTERFTVHPLPRFAGDPDLLAGLWKAASVPFPIRVHFGIVASGDEDIIELERAAALRQATEACAVAWEGAGGARAARFSGVPFVEIRGITDTADHNAAADFATNLRIAMASVGQLVVKWRAPW